MAFTIGIKLFILTIIIIIIIMTNNIIVSCQEEDYADIQPIIQKQKCDTNYCDSVVNKCKLTNRCSCNWKRDALCSKACIECLEEKFGRCCGCVGLCPIDSDSIHASHVADLALNESDYKLFDMLTETEDSLKRWTVKTIDDGHRIKHPVHDYHLTFAHRHVGNNIVDISHDESFNKLTCTVAFINRQLSMTKCKSYCVSMGASAFRWFHDGCCECVGKYCINYGFDEPKCLYDFEYF